MSDEEVEYMLTTVDNPFDPFTQFESWYAWDFNAGYHTNSFLARIAKTSDELSETDQRLAIQEAIDEIVTENVNGLYRKVSRKSS
jgi:hypothetical protein